jgi:hypothetical protein
MSRSLQFAARTLRNSMPGLRQARFEFEWRLDFLAIFLPPCI